MVAALSRKRADAPSAWDVLPAVRVPTVLISGAGECTADEMAAAAARLPDGRGLRLEGYGHLQTFWHVEVTAPLLLAFPDEHAGRP